MLNVFKLISKKLM